MVPNLFQQRFGGSIVTEKRAGMETGQYTWRTSTRAVVETFLEVYARHALPADPKGARLELRAFFEPLRGVQGAQNPDHPDHERWKEFLERWNAYSLTKKKKLWIPEGTLTLLWEAPSEVM